MSSSKVFKTWNGKVGKDTANDEVSISPPSPSSVTPNASLNKHCAFFLSFNKTSEYPGKRKNNPNAAKE